MSGMIRSKACDIRHKRGQGDYQSEPERKRFKEEINMTDAASQKAANFSALLTRPNGVQKGSSNLKSSTAKKLTIKNFKGNFFFSYLFHVNSLKIFLILPRLYLFTKLIL